MATVHFTHTTTLTPGQYVGRPWSDPGRVVLRTTDSNVWGGASGYTYTFKRPPEGGTDVDVVIVREGKNVEGRLLAFVLGTVGKGVLAKAFADRITAIEARHDAAASVMGAGARRLAT